MATAALLEAPPPATLTINAADVLATLAAGQAARTVAELAEALGCPVEPLADVLADLEATGLVDVWPDCPEGPSVTLSVLAAERLHVQIGPDGAYAPIGSRAASLERRGTAQGRGCDFDLLPDPSSKLPRMTLFIGLGMTWPVPYAEVCAACHGLRLGPTHYCLVCDASGIDWKLPAVPAPPPRRAPADGSLVGGRGDAGVSVQSAAWNGNLR